MPRDYRIYIHDILEACNRIQSYSEGFSEKQFYKDNKTIDAVVRNLGHRRGC